MAHRLSPLGFLFALIVAAALGVAAGAITVVGLDREAPSAETALDRYPWCFDEAFQPDDDLAYVGSAECLIFYMRFDVANTAYADHVREMYPAWLDSLGESKRDDILEQRQKAFERWVSFGSLELRQLRTDSS